MDRETLIERLHGDRRLAHDFLFEHRHRNRTPDFHGELIDVLHDGRVPEALLMAFRGAGKSTRTEEALVIRAIFREFRNCPIVGASEPRAVERLTSIKREFEQNDVLIWLFGDMKGPVWQETKVELRNGVVLQAVGRDQNLRGIKHLDFRPDYVVIDDVEDPELVQSPEGREKTMDWLLAELLPACDPRRVLRMLATPIDADSVPMRLKRRGDWRVLEFPIEHPGEAGERVASWPERYSLAWIDRQKAQYLDQGKAALWEREYMLRPVSEGSRVFKQEMFRVEPRVRRWEACYGMVDPARTARASSATTGWAVWSWLRNRLVVWAAGAEFLLPDEIVSLCFRIDGEFGPVWLGVEEDGLNEFLLQPLRHEQTRRGAALPIRALRAPRGKLDFIRGLQPYFAAREVIFANDLPDLAGQLLSFPTGRIDAPNALAYALPLRPGQAIYDSFSEDSIVPDLEIQAARPVYVAVNATDTVVTMQLLQFGEGLLRVVWDAVREGDPGQVAADLGMEALLYAARPLRAIAPAHHWERYTNVGLIQALGLVPLDVSRGAAFARGREWLRERMSRQIRGLPALSVSDAARWTLNGLFGGYCRAVDKRGSMGEFAEEGVYRVMMEGLEAACGLMAGAEADDTARNYEYTRGGQRYLSARPH